MFFMQSYERILVGVDEAGRGPIVGDMVIVAAVIPQSAENVLAKIGVKDSKSLDPKKRRSLAYSLVKTGILVVMAYVPPWEIDQSNINDVEAKYIGKMLGILSRILRRIEACEVQVYVDEVKGRGEFIRMEASRVFEFVEKLNVKVEPEADVKYSVVSAASILAKVSRDISLKPLRRIFGDLGSGYSSDLKTRCWISSYYAKYTRPPAFIRKTWSTLRNIAPSWYTSKKKTGKHKTILDYAKR